MGSSTNHTIYDVAERARTSPTTVSRVINNTGYPVSERLRQRVLRAVDELNFSPNPIAKSLKERMTKDVGVIIPTISNPFYAAMLLGIEEVANAHDYHVLLCNSLRDEKREQEYLHSLCDKQVRGVIISSLGSNAIKEYIDKGIHFVLLDQKIEDLDCPIIDINVAGGAFLAVEYLIQSGHRNIAFVSAPLTRWSRKQVFEGYREALQRYGIPLNQEYVIITEGEQEHEEYGYEFQNGKELAARIFQKKLDITAVMAVNDMTAFGCIQQFAQDGIKVPDDISVIGFDDIAFSEMFTPSLATVRVPAHALGRMAGSMLFDYLTGSDAPKKQIVIEPTLVKRNSVKILL